MSSESSDSSNPQYIKTADVPMSNPVESAPDNSQRGSPSKFSASGISTWAKNLKIPQPFVGSKDESPSGNSGQSTFSRFTSGFGLRMSPKSPQSDENSEINSPTNQSSFIGTITKGFVDSSKNAVKAVQVKARHVVSQNKRRYQEGGFDLDMTYITENIIAMGFPAGDMSSGFFGYVEGLYRNHMEEVIRFFETYHKGKYKVYNLCSERLYDASLFEGKVASFPFDDHNCPPIQLILLFCQSAYSWLKEDIENVVVVHCKAGMARTGLMISSLLLYLKFFPTAEESIDYYNQKRCIDGKGLVLPSQIRYVKYFERILIYFNGENQPGRRCMLRGFRLHRCPYWIRPTITVSDHNGVLFTTKKHPRTKDLSVSRPSGNQSQISARVHAFIIQFFHRYHITTAYASQPEDYWFSAPKKGIMVFALPGEPGLTELSGDFKIHFHDRQGDFYCWLNTTMIENRKVLNTSDLDGFDKRKLPSPGFQVEVVLVDYDAAAVSPRTPAETTSDESIQTSAAITNSKPSPIPVEEPAAATTSNKDTDDVFSDNEDEVSASSKSNQSEKPPQVSSTMNAKDAAPNSKDGSNQIANLTNKTEQVSIGTSGSTRSEPSREAVGVNSSGSEASKSVEGVSEFKAMAADASIFSFGDDDDSESE